MNVRPYHARLVDLDYYLETINCRQACPIHTNAAGYIAAIAEGDDERAYQIARRQNPLVYTLAQVCGHPCEDACRRGKLDAPIAICGLKRHATDSHNPGLGHDSGLPPGRNGGGQRVAVVGSGPAGLAAAHDLARLGHGVTIFEAASIPGGMLQLGLPAYRLSRDIIKLETDAILQLGVELRCNQRLGRDITLDGLRAEGYGAVFLALGAHKSRDLHLPGIDCDGVLRGVDFLLNMNLGYKVDLGKRVIVIGGGNVAIDVARTAARYTNEEAIPQASDAAPSDAPREKSADTRNADRRQSAEEPFQAGLAMKEVVDVARSAIRLGATEVSMVCLERRDQMPASEEEVQEALHEGVKLVPSRGPRRIVGLNGQCAGLEVIECDSVFDAEGRFNPTFVEGTEEILKADSIILAIGQASDLSFISPQDGIDVSARGLIAVDAETLATSAPGVYAGGDVAFGPRLIVHALADGQRAAHSIHAYLQQQQRTTSSKATMIPLAPRSATDDYYARSRATIPTQSIERRIGIGEVPLGFSKATAVDEAKRCLQCHVNTVFNAAACILCGACVDICPHNCLKLVPLSDIELNGEVSRAVEARYGISLDDFHGSQGSLRLDAVGSVMLKDEELCTRCGLCAIRCPTGAITMERLELIESTAA